VIDIVYRNGSVDSSEKDFAQAATLLQPLASFIESRINSGIDIWKVLNALYIGYYWFLLADLGHATPTTYPLSNQMLYPSNFSQPDHHHESITNNVFFNQILFKSVFSNIALNGSQAAQVSDALVSRSNTAWGVDPRIRRIYLCTERQPKRAINIIVSVAGVGFSLIATFYKLTIFILERSPEEWDRPNASKNQTVVPDEPTTSRGEDGQVDTSGDTGEGWRLLDSREHP
jgi:hypothetical protein